jgi:aryl-alcohol dehydrogenase-like predicted oxidoreductase
VDGVVVPPQLALGSVQWGLKRYGIANRTGQPALEEVRRLLRLAAAAGIRTIDTARAYGASEEVIGELVGPDPSWTVITKLAAKLPPNRSWENLLHWTRQSLDQSRRALRTSRLHAILLHRTDHRHFAGGVIWQELLRQRNAGLIDLLGVSVDSPNEADLLLEDADVVLVQVPCNLLDQRLVRSGLFGRLVAHGKKVVVRSIFLQGIAHLRWESLPARLREHAPSLQKPLRLIEAWSACRGLSSADAFLAFGHCLPGATVLVGCETTEQLAANVKAWRNAGTLQKELQQLARDLPPLDESIVNPANWPPLSA